MQPAENSTNRGGETETTNVKRNLHTTEDLDCQMSHDKSWKPGNASAKEDNTVQDVQHDQDLPLMAQRWSLE